MNKKTLPYKSPHTYKSEHRSELFMESLKATFLNKKMGIYSSGMHVTGICCDIQGSVISLNNAELNIISSVSDILVTKKVSFIMIERQGKTLTLEEE